MDAGFSEKIMLKLEAFGTGNLLYVRHDNRHLGRLCMLLALAPLMAGCSSGASDLFSRDAAWFARPGRLFIRNVSIDAPPLNPDTPVAAEDLVSPDGACPGMAPPPGPSDANALTDAPAAAPPELPVGGHVALGHAECDVVRGIGIAPDSVNLSTGPSGERVAVVTWTHGARPGIYTFTAGRLNSVEAAPVPVEQPKAKSRAKKKKKKAAAT